MFVNFDMHPCHRGIKIPCGPCILSSETHKEPEQPQQQQAKHRNQLTAMASLRRLTIAAAILATALSVSASSITFHNTGKHQICYKVEFSSGTLPTQPGVTCDSSPGLKVNAGKTLTINPSPDFNGAITAITNGIRGGRYEINFEAMPGSTWYDVDFQLGMSDGTLGPTSHQPLGNGQPSLSGEQDCLAKANAAWPSTTNKADLLANPDYLKQGPDGKLTYVYMDINAPQVVIDFFQVQAQFTAYIDAGSVAGVTLNDPGVAKAADELSWAVSTDDMEIIAY